MKFVPLIFSSTILFAACSGNEHPDLESNSVTSDTTEPPASEQTLTPLNSEEIVPGEYYEYHQSGGIKIKGFHNQELKREGLWISYYEDGTKWSECYYTDGKREGHSLTFYPNGKIRYVGEYKADKQTGKWTFYDEDGNVTEEKSY